MRLKFYAVDVKEQLHGVAATKVELVWRGELAASELGLEVGRELPLLTVVCDCDLIPRLVFFLRLGLNDGFVTEAARHLAYQSVTVFLNEGIDDGGQEAFSYQVQGWPPDWRSQLAIALDVPVSALDRISVGGPLPVAGLMGVGLRQSLRFFEHAFRRSTTKNASSN